MHGPEKGRCIRNVPALAVNAAKRPELVIPAIIDPLSTQFYLLMIEPPLYWHLWNPVLEVMHSAGVPVAVFAILIDIYVAFINSFPSPLARDSRCTFVRHSLSD